MKAATVYKKVNRVYIHALSKTEAGVWIATSPFLYADARTSPYHLGQLVMEAFGGSQEQVPHPRNWGNLLSPLLEQAGVKTWNTFMRKAQCLNLEATEDRLKIIPNRNLGTTEGFEPILEKTIELSLSSTVNQIGTVLLEALAECQ